MFDVCPDTTETLPIPQAAEGATKGPAKVKPASAVTDLNLTSRAMREEYLNRELEQELARAWRDNRDIQARERLINSHLRLASKYAAKMKRRPGTENDLMQEAVLGLMRAVDKFDPDRGHCFSTYAQWWIRAAIQEAVMRDNSSVRLKSSSANRTAFFTLPHIEYRAEMALRSADITPTREEVNAEAARMMGLDAARLEEIRSAMPATSSLNAPVAKNEEEIGERIDLLMCDAPTAEEITIRDSNLAYATNALEDAFSVLNAREVRIIRSRAMSLDPLTLEELSQEFGVTRERVRQIEAKAISKLREKLEEMGIESLDVMGMAA